jgi:ankyrin repeat protein
MELLLDRGAGVNVVSRHPIEATALVAALFGRRIDAAKLLIGRGADVTLRRGGRSFPRAGWSPLHYASAYGFLDVASMLLERGASVTAQDESGATPLDVASEEASRMLTRKES